MPIPLTSLLPFIASSIVLILAPGPDIIFTLTQGISRGRKAGIATALGLSAGNIVHTTAAALGLSLIFKTSIVAFTTFKMVGATYLFYLAYLSVKFRNEGFATERVQHKVRQHFISGFGRGFLMNVMNPKVALFFLAYLPQFAQPQISLSDSSTQLNGLPAQIMTLGAIFIVLVALIFSSIGYFAGAIGAWLKSRRSAPKYINVASATIFALIALKILLSRPS